MEKKDLENLMAEVKKTPGEFNQYLHALLELVKKSNFGESNAEIRYTETKNDGDDAPIRLAFIGRELLGSNGEVKLEVETGRKGWDITVTHRIIYQRK